MRGGVWQNARSAVCMMMMLMRLSDGSSPGVTGV